MDDSWQKVHGDAVFNFVKPALINAGEINTIHAQQMNNYQL